MEYSIKFTENCSQKLRAKLIDCFKSAGLLCESLYEGETTVYIGATFEALVNKVQHDCKFWHYFHSILLIPK